MEALEKKIKKEEAKSENLADPKQTEIQQEIMNVKEEIGTNEKTPEPQQAMTKKYLDNPQEPEYKETLNTGDALPEVHYPEGNESAYRQIMSFLDPRRRLKDITQAFKKEDHLAAYEEKIDKKVKESEDKEYKKIKKGSES
ncbi:hypothetical protein JW968_00555 [Candidatus Woesearchaeota archaeon]|nr:hypothetical protein [Candidatus Woesearchaeota archaeon]